MKRRAQRKVLDRVDPALRESLQKGFEAGFEPPRLTSFTMTGASSLYGNPVVHHEQLVTVPVEASEPERQVVRSASFERLTRRLSNTSTRRQALKTVGVAAVAAVGAAVVRPFGTATAVTCVNGGVPCGNFCCPKRTTCSQAFPNRSCCCPAGATPCGSQCCNRGVACLDSQRGICGCEAGTTPCGSGTDVMCCPAGTACPGVNSSSTCPSPNSSTFCTSVNSTVTT
jgi:hypothetical protein